MSHFVFFGLSRLRRSKQHSEEPYAAGLRLPSFLHEIEVKRSCAELGQPGYLK